MTSLISLALHRKVSTLMLFLALFFLGGVLSLGLNWDLYPRIKSPSLLVTSSYPGLPAEQIRELLTIPLEDSLSTLQGLKNLSSRSEDNAVLIELSFEWGTDMVQRGIETREKLDLAYLSLPQGASKPFLIPVDPNSEPIILLSLRPKDGDLSFVKALAEREVKSLLTQISGVGQVISFGGTQNEVKVIVDPRLLAGRGLTYEILLQTLTENLGDFPIGNIVDGQWDYMVQTKAKAQSIEEIADLKVLGTQAGAPLRIRDVAEVRLGEKDQRSSFYSAVSSTEAGVGGEGVVLKVFPQDGANPVSTIEAVKEALPRIQGAFAQSLEIQWVSDSSPLILENLQNVLVSGALGALLAFLILWIFLRSFLSSVLVGLTIPFTVLLVLIGFALTGTGINVLSLGGLAMGIGLMVDNAVVIVENLRDLAGLKEKNFTASVAAKVQEMASATLGSSLTTVIVFLPLFLLPGLLGAVFQDLAWGIVLSIACSYLVSIFLIPVLVVFFRRAYREPRTDHLSGVIKGYQGTLRGFIKKPFFVLLILLSLGAASTLILPQIPIRVFPQENRVLRPFTVDFGPNTSPRQMMRLAQSLDSTLGGYDGLDYWFETGGLSTDPEILSDTRKNTTQIRGTLLLPTLSPAWDRELEGSLQALFAGTGELSFPPSPHPLDKLLGLDNAGTLLLAQGSSPEASRALAEATASSLGLATSAVQPNKDNQQITLSPDRLASFSKGTNLSAIAQNLFAALVGQNGGEFEFRHRDIPIRVYSGEDYLSQQTDLESFSWAGEGGLLRLGELVNFGRELSYPYFLRENRKDITHIQVPGQAAQNQSLPEGVSEVSGNVFSENLQSILVIFAFGLLLLYLVMGLPIRILRCSPAGPPGDACGHGRDCFGPFCHRPAVQLFLRHGCPDSPGSDGKRPDHPGGAVPETLRTPGPSGS
jgi:HAE1 family hydrophobic/amphiphilic exporter-1